MNDASTGGAAAQDGPQGAAAELGRLRARVARLEAERLEAEHRIAGSLHLVAIYLGVRRSRVADDEARDALAAAETRIRGIARLHRRIHHDDEADRIAMRGFLDGLAAELKAALGLACVVGCDDFSVPHGVATQVAVIVGELGLNAARHAYDGRDASRLVIECRRLDGEFRLVVSDHGPGLPEGFEPGRSDGLGMAVVDAAVRRLGGRLGAHTDGGAVFMIVAPRG